VTQAEALKLAKERVRIVHPMPSRSTVELWLPVDEWLEWAHCGSMSDAKLLRDIAVLLVAAELLGVEPAFVREWLAWKLTPDPAADLEDICDTWAQEHSEPTP
jgi:hypothetical protein